MVLNGSCMLRGSSTAREEKANVRLHADVDLAVVAGLMPGSAGLHINTPLHPIVAEMTALHVSMLTSVVSTE